MNVFTFTGNLGDDAETRFTPSGAAVCNFSVAVTAGYGDKKTTTWVRCALWGKRAEGGLVPHLTKGTQVAVSGELSTREYESKGEKRTAVEVNVHDVTLLGGKTGNEAARPTQEQQQPTQARREIQELPPAHDDDWDSIPF
jgi:single-strand DNA-binding protein